MEQAVKFHRSSSWSQAEVPSGLLRSMPLHTSSSIIDGHQDILLKEVSSKNRSQKQFCRGSLEYSYRLLSFGFNLTTSLTDVLISYPCRVLCRRCQVSNGRRLHLAPITIIEVAIRLQRSQGISCLFKGVGSHLVINAMLCSIEFGIGKIIENNVSNVDQKSRVRHLLKHMISKALCAVVILPFYSAHLVESLQSEAASESVGVFDCIIEGFYRLIGYVGIQSHRLLPFRQLLAPTVTYFVLKYLMSYLIGLTALGVIHYKENQKDKLRIPAAMSSSIVKAGLSAISKSPTTRHYQRGHLHHYQEFVSNFTANIITDAMLYPFETILFRIHVQGTRTIIDDMDWGTGFLPVSSNYEGFLDCFYSVNAEKGTCGLFRGFGSVLLQYSMKFCIFKLVYILSSI